MNLFSKVLAKLNPASTTAGVSTSLSRRNKSRLSRAFSRYAWRALLLLLLAVAGMTIDGWQAFGKHATGARKARMLKSPQYRDGHFTNPEPLSNDFIGALLAWRESSSDGLPHTPIQTVAVDSALLATAPESGLRVTWFGHSTSLIEIDGIRVLTDPVWSERVSPFSWLGPKRWFPPLIALNKLPPINAVVVSHDHYDHLDYQTIVAMKDWNTTFIVPLGIGASLEYWGVPASRIVELDWWEKTRVGNIEIHATPARHASGRTLFDKDANLWAGYAFVGPAHRVYYSGDTGLFTQMTAIGERLGPFDVALVEAGQYHRTWPDWHIGPEQAVNASQRVRARTMLPVHWSLFRLGYHSWTEPVERVLVEGARVGESIATPRPGQSFRPAADTAFARWWPALKWETAQQHPIVSSQVAPK